MGLPSVQTGWLDTLLEFIPFFRFAVAVFTVIAGLAALFTERALVDRDKPLTGIWKLLRNTPLESRKLSPWGYRILAMLFLAGTLQFFGDWLKDWQADRQTEQRMTALSSGIEVTVAHATTENLTELKEATKENQGVIQEEAKKQTDQVVRNIGDRLTPIIGQQKKIARDTEATISSTITVQREVTESLYPFKEIAWNWDFVPNEKDPAALNIVCRVGATMKKRNVSEFWSPAPGDSAEKVDSSLADQEVTGQDFRSNLFYASIILVFINDERGETLLNSVLEIPEDFEDAKYTGARINYMFGAVGYTNFVCLVKAPAQSYDQPSCSFHAYPGAPLVDIDAPRSRIHYLDQLAGKSLVIIQALPPEDQILRLTRVCLHIGNRALCFDANEFKAGDFNGLQKLVANFPPDIDSILNKMQPGTLERTSLDKDGAKTFTAPE